MWRTLLLLALLQSSTMLKCLLAQHLPFVKHECREEAHCPPYHYCNLSPWTGNRCTTNFKLSAAPSADLNRCRVNTPGDGGLFFPDHEVCRLQDITAGSVHETKYSASLCFPGLRGYFCANAYFMPCIKHYDWSGNVVPGMCPRHFDCLRKHFVDGKSHLVCVPDNTRQTKFPCQEHFDCGYSNLLKAWNRCFDGQCIRIDE